MKRNGSWISVKGLGLGQRSTDPCLFASCAAAVLSTETAAVAGYTDAACGHAGFVGRKELFDRMLLLFDFFGSCREMLDPKISLRYEQIETFSCLGKVMKVMDFATILWGAFTCNAASWARGSKLRHYQSRAEVFKAARRHDA